MLAFLLALAVDAPASEPPPALPEPPHLYLAPPPIRCDTNIASDEILVCSRAELDARYRLKPIDDGIYQDQPVRAQMKIGNGSLALHAEDKEIGGGMHSKRAMITLTIPF